MSKHPHPPQNNTPVHERIVEAMTDVLKAADRLVSEYEFSKSQSRMQSAETQLIEKVKRWRKECGVKP